jgi:ribonucleoside-diphosphate reductase beta chain
MTAAAHLHGPQELYRHWEHEQWNPWSIDLTIDRGQWQSAMTEEDKGLVYWALSSLIVAEERITTKFAGLVMAAENGEEASYLASRQVDEARHMQFYAHFQNEVIDEPAAIAAHVARSREQLGDSFAVIFDQALVCAHERLAASPADPFAKVDFVTTYHLIIESTLGLTAFEFITRYLTGNELLPGFVDGYSPHPPRRAAPHRLRRLVPAPSRPAGPRARSADPRRAARAAPRRRQCTRSPRSRRRRLGGARSQW